MKNIFLWLGAALLVMAALATPISIGVGLYDWVFVDLEFKMALWNGFVLWVKMVVVGIFIGFPAYIYGTAQ